MHAFVQSIEGDRVVDRSWRAEEPAASTGYVLEAPYLEPEPDGTWTSLLRSFFPFPSAHPPRKLWFARPFDEHGNDVRGLFAADAEPGISYAHGTITPLEGGDVVLRDFWSGNRRWLEMVDFAIACDDGFMVVIACGMAPLVVAPPARTTFEKWHGASSERLRELANIAEADVDGIQGSALELRAGDVVEVRGVARPLSTTVRTIDFSHWGAGYRTAPPMPDRLIGDEEGTRLIVRYLQAT